MTEPPNKAPNSLKGPLVYVDEHWNCQCPECGVTFDLAVLPDELPTQMFCYNHSPTFYFICDLLPGDSRSAAAKGQLS